MCVAGLKPDLHTSAKRTRATTISSRVERVTGNSACAGNTTHNTNTAGFLVNLLYTQNLRMKLASVSRLPDKQRCTTDPADYTLCMTSVTIEASHSLSPKTFLLEETRFLASFRCCFPAAVMRR